MTLSIDDVVGHVSWCICMVLQLFTTSEPTSSTTTSSSIYGAKKSTGVKLVAHWNSPQLEGPGLFASESEFVSGTFSMPWPSD